MLPGKAIANPKEYVQAITLKSGRVLPERVVPSRRNEDVAIQEEEESVDIEAEERVEKESVNQSLRSRRTAHQNRQKETRRGGKLFLFPHHSNQCCLSQHVSRNKWRRNAESF
ncbi:unnamed protein product [Microthlaspi erraticum]|uniref:Uncharacterized protein n=1 Tax=Microthlaspi erraticum TaxID=1685480 RepID=A0A6D2I0R5_9BRAS|nr:unnamed protein product [Microthlaspi erraticum]